MRSHLPLRILLGAALAVVLGGVGVALNPSILTHTPIKGYALSRYASDVLAACKNDAYPPRCYDTEIPKLMDRGLSMEEAFEVTKLVQEQAGNYFYCHVLGHNLSARETAKDPSAWTEVIARCPTGMCANGCLHGAIQERFRTNSLTDEEIAKSVPMLSRVCEPGGEREFTGLEQPICYHALGHLTMYVTEAHMDRALDACDAIAEEAWRNGSENQDIIERCYEGAYMQVFQFLDDDDIALVKEFAPETPEEADAFCRTFEGQRRWACHRESWPLSFEQIVAPGGFEAFCSMHPGSKPEQECYNVISNIVAAMLNYDIERIVPVCDGLPEIRKAQCFAHAASRFIDTDHGLADGSVELCRLADERGIGDRCYKELLFYALFSFHPGSAESEAFCKRLPDGWSERCLAGEGANYSRYILET